ncbi:MAG: ATP-binding protein [Synechococcales bacterium]|nr:ATP-binding protein [Synechococcales bacterium]
MRLQPRQPFSFDSNSPDLHGPESGDRPPLASGGLCLNRLPAAPLRWVLVVPFVLQVSLAVGLIGYLSIRNGQKAVADLMDQLMATTGQMVSQHLDNYLSVPSEINRMNVHLVERGIIDAQNFEALSLHFWQQAQIYSPGSYFGFALETGEYVGAGDWLDGQGVVVDQTASNGKSVSYTVDANGNRIEAIYHYEYFPKEEYWYPQTVTAGKSIWSLAIEDVEPIYVAAGITQPVYAPDGSLLGVMNADLVLSHISSFLAALNPSPQGRLFIIERNGNLVANSHPMDLFTQKDDGTLELVNVLASDDALSRAVAQHVQSTFGSFDAVQQEAITLKHGGDRQFVKVIPWRDEGGLDWLVVMAVPESAFMGQIQANTRITIALCLAALAAAIGLGLVTSRWIAEPVLRLSQASWAIAQATNPDEANHQLNQRVMVRGIEEIETLAHAFNQMAAKLQDSFLALEASNVELEQRVAARTAELTATLTHLRQTQARLIHAEKMSGLGQLVAGVAHEINNPVTFIYSNLEYARGYVDDLLKLVELCQQHPDSTDPTIQKAIANVDLDFLKEDLPKLLDSMQVGSERIHEIVKSLRTFAQLEGSPLKVVDIHAGIDSTLMMLQSQIQNQGKAEEIRILKEYGSLPRVECYAGQLNQVFMHLLTNAIRALEDCNHCPCNNYPDGRQIRIRTQLVPGKPGSGGSMARDLEMRDLAAEEHILISIADNGPGIPEEVRSHLFNPFFTTRSVGQGLGLGLAVSYQIITELHGGSIECISELGQGTEFILKIPLTQCAENRTQESGARIQLPPEF